MRVCLLFASFAAATLLNSSPRALAQGTKQWTTDRYESFERGTTDGVAIRNDGRLEVGMSLSTLYTAEEGYVWSIAAGRDGDIFAGVGGDKGGSAAVVRIAADASARRFSLARN